jgi:predicted kinase
MRKLYVLVGVPGSGKSTWISSQSWSSDCRVVSTDMHVEAYAKTVGKTYSDVFKEYMPTAVKLMANDVISAKTDNVDVIWDQTSTSARSRQKKFAMLPYYYAIAVVFKTPNVVELQRRLNSRPGKNIPWDVVSDMIDAWEEPVEGEGFDEIWYAT